MTYREEGVAFYDYREDVYLEIEDHFCSACTYIPHPTWVFFRFRNPPRVSLQSRIVLYSA